MAFLLLSEPSHGSAVFSITRYNETKLIDWLIDWLINAQHLLSLVHGSLRLFVAVGLHSLTLMTFSFLLLFFIVRFQFFHFNYNRGRGYVTLDGLSLCPRLSGCEKYWTGIVDGYGWYFPRNTEQVVPIDVDQVHYRSWCCVGVAFYLRKLWKNSRCPDVKKGQCAYVNCSIGIGFRDKTGLYTSFGFNC